MSKTSGSKDVQLNAFRTYPAFFVAISLCVVALCLSLITAAAARAEAPARADRPKPRPIAEAALTSSDHLARLIARAPLGGTSSAVLIDIRTGQVLSTFNAAQPMPPASVTKVLTTLYGIDLLGENHAFSTEVLTTGSISAGRLDGDLVLLGGGDPELDTDELAQLVSALTDVGITSVSGRFLYDDNSLPHIPAIGSGQPANAAYNPGLSGLNLNFNRVFFEWEGSGDALDLRLEARDQGHSPPISSSRIVAEDRPGPVYLYSSQGGADHWSIARGALRKPGGVWLPVRDPGRYAADAFAQIARSNGISMPLAEPAGPQDAETRTANPLATIRRRPLFEVCRGMLHFSTNVTAELVGLAASQRAANSPMPDLVSSARRMSGWLAGRYGVTSQKFEDHSGLSSENRISAADMAAVILQADRAGRLEGLLRRHFVARPGSNKPAVKEAEVRAKTGTLNFVRGLAGTIEGARGQRLAFAIFSADLAARAAADHTRTNPPGARRFSNRAVSLEQAILASWLTRFAN